VKVWQKGVCQCKLRFRDLKFFSISSAVLGDRPHSCDPFVLEASLLLSI